MGMVALDKVETPEDMESLRGFIEEHHKHTGSSVAKRLLDDFGTEVTNFVKVGTNGYSWISTGIDIDVCTDHALLRYRKNLFYFAAVFYFEVNLGVCSRARVGVGGAGFVPLLGFSLFLFDFECCMFVFSFYWVVLVGRHLVLLWPLSRVAQNFLDGLGT